jgi:vancomycin resistance protein VanW
LFKENRKKDLKDFLAGHRFAKQKSSEQLPCIWKGHTSLILKHLHGVDMELQRNKAVNLRLASNEINGTLILPGQTFSFWSLVGDTTAEKGYLEGLVLSSGKLKTGVGGGLCQLANMIHYLVLHTPLEVVELHHHSDAIFPDHKRTVPFGTGTSIVYKAVDYRFRNPTHYPVELALWQDEAMLYGEIRSTIELDRKYRLVEENSFFQKEGNDYYRNSEVYRMIIDKKTGSLSKELILKNHSKVLYDHSLIPKDQIQ